MKQTLQSRFLHCVVPYLSSGIIPPTDYVTTIKSLHTEAVSDFKSLQTASPKIVPEKANLPRPYRTTFSQLRLSFCSYLHSFRERIGLIPSLLFLCGVEPHTTINVFFCFSYQTPLDRAGPVRASTPCVGVPVGPPFLRPLPPSPRVPSFWRTRELGAIIIIPESLVQHIGLKSS